MKYLGMDISRYLRLQSTPAGAILQHILCRKNMTQKELSRLSGICTQHINAFIKGKRRFSVTSSMTIEKALGLDCDGLFYICQCRYDIAMEKKRLQSKPNIANICRATFWDVDLEKIDWQKGKRWAIQRVLEYGSESDYDEIVKFYGLDSIKKEIACFSDSLSFYARRNATKLGLL